MQTSALFGAKSFKFFEIYGVSAQPRERAVKQCRHFADKGKGVNFSRFFADVVYGRPLV